MLIVNSDLRVAKRTSGRKNSVWKGWNMIICWGDGCDGGREDETERVSRRQDCVPMLRSLKSSKWKFWTSGKDLKRRWHGQICSSLEWSLAQKGTMEQTEKSLRDCPISGGGRSGGGGSDDYNSSGFGWEGSGSTWEYSGRAINWVWAVIGYGWLVRRKKRVSDRVWFGGNFIYLIILVETLNEIEIKDAPGKRYPVQLLAMLCDTLEAF